MNKLSVCVTDIRAMPLGVARKLVHCNTYAW
jgi:hypothetical protein